MVTGLNSRRICGLLINLYAPSMLGFMICLIVRTSMLVQLYPREISDECCGGFGLLNFLEGFSLGEDDNLLYLYLGFVERQK